MHASMHTPEDFGGTQLSDSQYEQTYNTHTIHTYMHTPEDFGGIQLSDSQYEQEWAEELDRIRAPDVSLGAIHVMALAQVLRRPVIVFAQPFVRGALGMICAHFSVNLCRFFTAHVT